MQKESLPFILIVFLISFSCRSDNSVFTDRIILKGTSLYIDSVEGNDRYPGTRYKPVKTINEVNKRMGENPSNLLFHGGQTFSGTLQITNISGTEKAPLIIGSYGRGRATVDGGLREAIRIRGCSKMIVRNLNLKGNGRKDGNTTNGLTLISCNEIKIENLDAEGFQKSGVDLYNCRYMKVRKVVAQDNGFCGINIMGSDRQSSRNIIVRNCRAENNPGDPTILDNHSGNGILVGMSDSVTIDYCIATNNGWDMPRLGNGPVGIWAWMSDHIKIRFCISYRNKTSKDAKDGGGFDLDGGVTNSVIEYCLSFDNQGAGYGLFQYPGASNWSDNIIRCCASIYDAHTTEGSGSFFIWNGSGDSGQLTDCKIYNNLILTSSAPAVSFENASFHESFVFKYNLFMGKGDLVVGKNTGSTFRGNLWIGRKGDVQIY